MTELELLQQRRARWHVGGNPVRAQEQAAEFLNAVGICLVYPLRTGVTAPTCVGAYFGSDENLPTSQQAFKSPRAEEARELMLRLLRARQAFEAPFAGENIVLLSPETFPYFYALVGERNPKRDLRELPATDKISQLTRDAYAIIQQKGAIPKRRLGEALGGAPSEAALDRALNELWSRLLITRVDYQPKEGVFWEALHRWAPDAVKLGSTLSLPQALSALLSKYLEAVIAAEMSEIEAFFSHFTSRGRVRDAANALLAARELSYVSVGRRTLVQITPTPAVPRPERERRPTQRTRIAK